MCDWLAKWIIMLLFMDLGWPRVFRRPNVGLVNSCSTGASPEIPSALLYIDIWPTELCVIIEGHINFPNTYLALVIPLPSDGLVSKGIYRHSSGLMGSSLRCVKDVTRKKSMNVCWYELFLNCHTLFARMGICQLQNQKYTVQWRYILPYLCISHRWT